MPITIAQLHEIRDIIATYHSAFIVNTIGPDAVSIEILEKLKALGLVDVTVSSPEDAYLFGQALAAASDPKLATMGFPEFKEYLRNNPVPLSGIEKNAIAFAREQAGQYISGLGSKVTGQINQAVVSSVGKRVATNIERRESIQKLAGDLRWMSDDWSRDFDRIAVTEKHTAMQQGVADHYIGRYGEEVLVAKRPTPSACKHCKRLHLGPDGAPRIFKLSTLEANGINNVGRKAADWLATVGPVHPNCFLPGTFVTTSVGQVLIEDILPGALVQTHTGMWRSVTHTWAAEFSGKVSVITTQGGKVTATQDHPFLLGSRDWETAGRLKEGDYLRASPLEGFSLPDTKSVDFPAPPCEEGRFASILFGFSPGGVPVSAVHFDGNLFIRESKVNEIASHHESYLGLKAGAQKGLVDFALVGGFELTRLAPNNGEDELLRLRFTPDSGMEGGDVCGSLTWTHLGHTVDLGFRPSPGANPRLLKSKDYSTSGYEKLFGYSFHREQVFKVESNDKVGVEFVAYHGDDNTYETPIVNVLSEEYRGKVYNLTVSVDNSYIANGLVVHNCQCMLMRIPEGWGFNESGQMVLGGDLGIKYDDEADLQLSLALELDLQKSFALQGHLSFQGIPIAIENKVGTIRRWVSEDGAGETKMLHAYGYIKHTEGDDGDEIDVYIGPAPDAPMAYIVHQQSPDTGRYDENKVMLGFLNEEQAVAAYKAQYDNPDFLVAVSPMDIAHFKRWIGGTEPKPGEMCKSGTLVRPMILPLSKAGALQSTGNVSQFVIAPSSMASHRAPGEGNALSSIAMGVKPKPPKEKSEDLKDWYKKQVDDMAHNREAIKRDPEIYEVTEKLNHPVTRMYVMPEVVQQLTPEEIETQRKALESVKSSHNIVNTVDVGVDERIRR